MARPSDDGTRAIFVIAIVAQFQSSGDARTTRIGFLEVVVPILHLDRSSRRRIDECVVVVDDVHA